MDTIMDRETRHRKLMDLSNQHRELDKAKPQAQEYPHVYGAPTGGNILNAFGKKYALPLGTERHLEDVIAVKYRFSQ
jgi:antiviral helicase SLH1